MAESEQVSGIWRHSSHIAKFANYLLTFNLKFNFFTATLVGSTIISKVGRFDQEVSNQSTCLNTKLDHSIASLGEHLNQSLASFLESLLVPVG